MKRKGTVRFTRKILNAPTSPFQLSRFSAPFPALLLRPACPIFDTFGPRHFQPLFRTTSSPNGILQFHREIRRYRKIDHPTSNTSVKGILNTFAFHDSQPDPLSALPRSPVSFFPNTAISNFHKSRHAYSITVSARDICD